MLRYDIINWLIKKYDYEWYLEIGMADGDCFKQVNCKYKVGVDPELPYDDAPSFQRPTDILVKSTSDLFFRDRPTDYPYDIIFIDGLHLAEQVERDIHNSLKHLAEGGTIVVHDCNPPTADHAAREPRVFKRREDGTEYPLWNGDVWKAWVMTRILHSELIMCVVDADWGCGIIKRWPKGISSPRHPWERFSEEQTRAKLTYQLMADDRVAILGLVSMKGFREMHSMEVDTSTAK